MSDGGLLHREDLGDLLSAIERKMDDAREDAFIAGLKEGKQEGRDEVEKLPMEVLLERYNYLVMGGTFQLQEGSHPYLNGFMDAVTTLREQVKP